MFLFLRELGSQGFEKFCRLISLQILIVKMCNVGPQSSLLCARNERLAISFTYSSVFVLDGNSPQNSNFPVSYHDMCPTIPRHWVLPQVQVTECGQLAQILQDKHLRTIVYVLKPMCKILRCETIGFINFLAMLQLLLSFFMFRYEIFFNKHEIIKYDK